MRLNPFVYFSETDIRFYMLVAIGLIISIDLSLIVGFSVGVAVFQQSILYKALIFLLVDFLIIFFIYWNYRRATQKIIEKSGMKAFERDRFPEHFDAIEKFYAKLPHTFERPILMYEPPGKESEVSAFTFGSRKRMYIGLTAGMITNAFYEDYKGFESIVLHEMGHIKNKDVNKAYLAASLVRSIRLIFPAILAILLVPMLCYDGILVLTATMAGYDLDYIISLITPTMIIYIVAGGLALFLLVFGVILYVLRNQIIRLREFYADARVFEWEKSPIVMVETLKRQASKKLPKFELLTKFHPSTSERIQVLKDNSKLFTPNLWAAFSLGYLYGFFVFNLPHLSQIFLFEQPGAAAEDFMVTFGIFTALITFVIFFCAISSEFHKTILQDIFIKRTRFLSTKTIMSLLKVTMAFSLGKVFSVILASFWIPDFWNSDLLTYPLYWLYEIFYFGTTLFFLVVFTSMLIRRSLSEKAAKKNFIAVSVLASIFYSYSWYSTNLIAWSRGWLPLLLLFMITFSIAVYLVIKLLDRRLRCPVCQNKLLIPSKLQLTCPHCQNRLYSWAIYPFSESSAKEATA